MFCFFVGAQEIKCGRTGDVAVTNWGENAPSTSEVTYCRFSATRKRFCPRGKRCGGSRGSTRQCQEAVDGNNNGRERVGGLRKSVVTTVLKNFHSYCRCTTRFQHRSSTFELFATCHLQPTSTSLNLQENVLR